MKDYLLLVHVQSELTKDALVSDVRQAFMRHASHLTVVSATASLFLDLELVRSPSEPTQAKP